MLTNVVLALLEVDAIVAELNEILDEVELNRAEQRAIKKRIKAFKKSNPEIQVNCQPKVSRGRPLYPED